MRKGLVLGACLLIAGPAFGQSLGERSGVNSALGVTPRTADFVSEAAASDMFEIQSSQLAAARTQGDVQSFANQMVTDHTKTTSELQGLAPEAKVHLPRQMTRSQTKMLDKLKGLKGDAFAKQYMDDQVRPQNCSLTLRALRQRWRQCEAERLGRADLADAPASSRHGANHLQKDVGGYLPLRRAELRQDDIVFEDEMLS